MHHIPGARGHDYGCFSPEGLFRVVAADGWQSVQLAFKKSIEGVSSVADIPALVPAVQAAIAETGVSVGVLGAYVETSLMDDEARRGQVAAFTAQIPVAKALNAGCIGTETTNMDKQPAGTTREVALAQLRKSLCEILPVAQENRVFVAIEPVYYHALATPELVRDILKEMQSPWLRVIFDPVNLLAPEEIADQYALWQRSMEAFGDKIKAVHVKGIHPNAEGALVSCGLEESVIDHAYVFDLLRHIEPVPVFREELKPEFARGDLAFMRQYI